ncbi:MAG: biliverdin-producing heme oxygenase [Alphaproteobacteria bacterium]|nr:biliverdin-producing heme oxygenase [Alphaproteobacteria bacterium]
MIHAPLRQLLRERTDDLHRILDEQVGVLEDKEDYIRYLSGTYAFRAALEPALPREAEDVTGLWGIVPLVSTLHRDLADLGVPFPRRVAAPDLEGRAAQAAAAYVLEGSALGARVIARRAAVLGIRPDHGGRHLALQTAGTGRWKSFQAWLEAAQVSHEQAVSAARAVFKTALAAHGLGDTTCTDDAGLRNRVAENRRSV